MPRCIMTHMMPKSLRFLLAFALLAAIAYIQAQQESQAERFRRMSIQAETKGLA